MNPRPAAPLSSALDEAFMARVHRSSLFLAGIVSVIAALSAIGETWSLGFFGAALWSVGNLWTLERLVRGALRPGPVDKFALAGALLFKLPILYAVLVALVLFGDFAASAIVAGVSLPLFVIVLKVLGRALALRLRQTGPELPEPRS